VNIIDSYQFGLIVVNGRKYTSDVIVFPDSVRDNWRRKTGHQLSLEDIADVMSENPDMLVVGTGASGLMEVPLEVQRTVKTRGTKLVAEATEKACRIYNQFCLSQKTVAALHITC
jgi:hypothetical protein